MTDNFGGTAQVPGVDPALVTEGVLPLQMCRDRFFVSGSLWAKFSAKHPHVSFDDFWSYKLRKYDRKNARAREFFASFTRNAATHESELRSRYLNHQLRRFEGGQVAGFIPPYGFIAPKLEPEEFSEYSTPEYTYKLL